jgi:hypothetical protein
MANTFELIASTELTGTQANITFSSIPNTFTDLKILLSSRFNNTNNYFEVFFNNDTSSGQYFSKELSANGTTAGSGGWTTVAYWGFSNKSNYTASTFGNAEIYIPNYANTTYRKSASLDTVTETNTTAANMLISAGNWYGTGAIHTVTLRPDAPSNWVQYTSAYLYGIKNS